MNPMPVCQWKRVLSSKFNPTQCSSILEKLETPEKISGWIKRESVVMSNKLCLSLFFSVSRIADCRFGVGSFQIWNFAGPSIALQLSSTQNKSHVKWKTKWDQLSRTSFSKYHNSQQNQVNCVQILLFQHWIWHCLLWKCWALIGIWSFHGVAVNHLLRQQVSLHL